MTNISEPVTRNSPRDGVISESLPVDVVSLWPLLQESSVGYRRRIPLRQGTFTANEDRQGQPSRALATVTVVITCYNYGHFLAEAVTSAMVQLGVEVDVIIVDDGSTDSSAAVGASLSAADPRIRCLSHAENQGPVSAFNTGWAMATGEFLVRLDADDVLTPGSLMRAIHLARRFPSVGLIYGHPLHFIDDGRRRKARMVPTAWSVWPGPEWVRDRCRDARNVITSSEVVMRSSVVDRVGGMRDLGHAHDMELWLRLASYSDVGYIHGADQVWHREHPGSLSARRVDIAVDLAERRRAFTTLFAGPTSALEWSGEAHRTVMEVLDQETLELLEHEVDANGGRSAIFARLLTDEVTPTRTNLKRRERILRRTKQRRGPMDRSMSLARRARGRIRWDRARRNWHVNGEY